MLLQSLALAWLSGSALAAFGLPIWLAVAAAGLALPLRRSRSLVAPAVMAIALAGIAFAGGRWYRQHLPVASATDVSHFAGVGPTRVRGVLEGDRDERERALILRLGVSALENDSGWHSATGLLLLRVPLSVSLGDGDAVEARGKLVQPAVGRGFDYRAYLAREGVYAEMDYPSVHLLRTGAGSPRRHALVKLRERLADGISSVLPEPEASLGAGIALGTRRVIEPSLNQALTATGTAQIIVASGYNITVVSAFMFWLLAGLVGRARAAIAVLLAIVAYSAFVGFYPSVFRAAIMGSIFVLAQLLGRPHSGFRALIIATAVMVGLNPLALSDLSFLLSLFGTAGLFLFAPPLARALEALVTPTTRRGSESPITRGLIASGSTTVAAMAGSLPIILVAFQTLSLSALPANLLLFPLVPAIMAASGATAIAGAIWHPAALLLSPVAYALLAFMVGVVQLCARLPASQVQVGWFGVPWAAAVLALFGSMPIVVTRTAPAARQAIDRLVTEAVERMSRRVHSVRWFHWSPGHDSAAIPVRATGWAAGAVVLMAAGVVVALVPLAAGTEPAALHVTYLDVGPGSAILVESGSQRILLDGGPPGDGTVRALDRVLPPWQRSLNLAVLTEPSAGHLGGLPSVLHRYRVGAVVDATVPALGSTGRQEALAATQSVELPRAPVTYLQIGEWLISVEAAQSERRNAAEPSATVVARLGDHRVVLAGDAAAAVAADLRSINRGNASIPPRPPSVAVLEAGQAPGANSPPAAIPPGFGDTLVYRTTENGDVTVDVSRSGLSVHVGRGPTLGLRAGGG